MGILSLLPTNFAAFVATTFILYQIFKVIYRVAFHPLRHFPGPKLAAATYWYEIYFDVFKSPGGQFIYHLDYLHSIYGPVIRCSPEEIHVKDSEFFDVLYAGPGHVRDKWERSSRANGSPGAIPSTLDHDLHRIRRSAVNPYFSKKAVRELEASTRSVVDRLCEGIHEFAKEGKILHVGTAFTAVTLDVILQYCYDTCDHCVEEPDFAPKWKALLSAFDAVPIAKHFPTIFNTLRRLPRSIAVTLNPDIAPFLDLQGVLARQAKEGWLAEQNAAMDVQQGEKPKTIFQGIMRSNIPRTEKTVERLTDEAFVLVVAGAETTARILTVILSHLLQNKDLFNRLRAALDPVMKSGLPESRFLEEVPLLKAVVQEGLRIAAPVTNRQILIAPNEDLKCHGWVVPRGTPTSMTFQDVLYDPVIFPDPRSFDPDRWLSAAAEGRRLDRYLVTFSKGGRSCVGSNLAQSEMYLGVAALVSRFDLELHDFDRKRDLDIIRDCFLGMPSRESKGVRVKVTARKD